MFAFGVDHRTLRQRQTDFIRLAERWHERGAIRFAFSVRVCALPLNQACEIWGEKR